MKKEKQYTSLFQSLVNRRGWGFQQASKKEDMEDHVDCHVEIRDNGRPLKRFTVDLKGTKYTSRANEGKVECMCQYIEFLNVLGNKGWLFGKADYIAILDETEEKFYLIQRQALIVFCEKLFGVDLSNFETIEDDLLKLKCWVERSSDSHHHLYRRRDRKDIVTQINMNDVKELSTIIIGG